MRTTCSVNVRHGPPSFWKVAPGVYWLQVHSPQQARKVERRKDAKLVAYSVAGSYLRTFEISKPEQWVQDYIARPEGSVRSSDALEVSKEGSTR